MFRNLLLKNPVLKETEFKFYLLFRFTLIFALNMQSTIIYFWVFQITGDKLKLGFVGLSEVIPAILFSLFSGHFVDLHEKKKMILICAISYFFLGIFLFGLTTPFAGHHLSKDMVLYLVYFFVFLGGIIRAFYGPSAFSLLSLLLPRTLYANGTSWSSMAWQIGAVLGPLTAGAMIAWKGIEAGMILVVIIELIPISAILAIKAKPIMKKIK